MLYSKFNGSGEKKIWKDDNFHGNKLSKSVYLPFNGLLTHTHAVPTRAHHNATLFPSCFSKWSVSVSDPGRHTLKKNFQQYHCSQCIIKPSVRSKLLKFDQNIPYPLFPCIVFNYMLLTCLKMWEYTCSAYTKCQKRLQINIRRCYFFTREVMG